jgi:hypothetical protein
MIGIVSFLSLLVTALVVAFFARRILGAPVGRPRSVLVGLIMVSLLGNLLRAWPKPSDLSMPPARSASRHWPG